MSQTPPSPRIVLYPDPVLRIRCEPVEKFDASLAELAAQMLRLMKAHNGVGLAGPQIGSRLRIFVCNPTGNPEDDRVYVNPELSDLVGAVEAEEGCLSIPDVRVMVRRARQCTLTARDLHGQPVQLSGENLIARIWQHEVDHLDGRLIIDRMSATDKIATKKQLAQLEADYRKQRKR